MSENASVPARDKLRRPRTALLVTGLLGAIAIAVDFALGGRSSYHEPAMYVGVQTAEALAGFAAAYLLFFRFRQKARLDVLLIAVGLAILAASNLFYGAIPVAFDRPSDVLSTWVLAASQVLGALVLVVAAFAPPRKVVRPRHAAWIVSLYALVALGMLTEVMLGAAALLPTAIGQSGTVNAALVFQLLLIALFAAASIAYLRRAEEDHDAFMTWLSIAAALRVLAGVAYSFTPRFEAGWLSAADVFRMLFYFALVAAAAGEVTSYWKASRETAVLDERQRIARDLHDGIAQELAFIVRRAHRAVEKGLLAADALQIAHAAERALDESRGVLATLTRPLDEPLDVVLSEAVRGVADRVGATVALSLDPDVHVSPDVREALVRIVREAVTNAARHGDARLVRVELENHDGLRLRIVDDGRGFDSTSTRRRRSGGYGLTSMADRARSIGGTFHVTSRRGTGTAVEVELP